MAGRRSNQLQRLAWRLTAGFFMLLPLTQCFAQQSSTDAFRPSAAADTSSPRATLKSFIDACNETYDLIQQDKYLDPDNPLHARVTERILDCIDVSEIPAFARNHRATESAICIKEILDRTELPQWNEIPDETQMLQLQKPLWTWDWANNPAGGDGVAHEPMINNERVNNSFRAFTSYSRCQSIGDFLTAAQQEFRSV